MKKILFSLILSMYSLVMWGQDGLIYTISANYENELQFLDSIVIENLINDEKVKVDNLPNTLTNYTLNIQRVSSGLNDLSANETDDFILNQTQPGIFKISYKDNKLLQGQIMVFNSIGLKLFDQNTTFIPFGETTISIEKEGVFIIAIQSTQNKTSVFKVIGHKGTDNISVINSTVHINNAVSNTPFKVRQIGTNNGIDIKLSYNQGDILKVTVYKKDYFAESIEKNAFSDENFVFDLRYVKVVVVDTPIGNEKLDTIINGTITYVGLESTDTIKRGAIICSAPVKGAPNGFLYKIKEIVTKNDTTSITTEPVSLEEAIEDIDISMSFNITDSVKKIIDNKGQSVPFQRIQRTSAETDELSMGIKFSIDYNNTINDNVILALKGSIELIANMDFELRIKKFNLQRMKFTLQPQFKANVTASVEGKLEKEVPIHLYDYYATPILVINPLPTPPIVIVPVISVDALLSMDGKVTFTAKIIDIDYKYTCGFLYTKEDGFTGISNNDSEPLKYMDDIELAVSGTIRLSVPDLRLSCRLYNSKNASISLAGGFYGELATDAIKVDPDLIFGTGQFNPSLKFTTGLDLSVSAELKLLFSNKDLIDYNFTFDPLKWDMWERNLFPEFDKIVMKDIGLDSARVTCNLTKFPMFAFPISEHGFCWAKDTEKPTIKETNFNKFGLMTTLDGIGGVKPLSYSINDLNSASTYTIRPYFTNWLGTFYGEPEIFTTQKSEIITLSQSDVILAIGETAKVIITGGSGNYSFTPDVSQFANIQFVKDTIRITGLASGTAILEITDVNNVLKVPLSIVVTEAIEDLTLSAYSVLVKENETAQVFITAGSGSYSLLVSDLTAVEAEIKDSTIIIKGKRNGMGTITVTDNKTSKTADIAVKVEASDLNTVTDIDGNIYHIVTIGTQTWMVENLKTTRYRNGDAIGTTTAVTTPFDATSKYQWAYNGDENNVAKYGRLYTWYAATDTRNIAPSGWHVPTDAEWTTLKNHLIANGFNYDGTTKDNKIAKALAATTDWNTYSGTGTIGNDLTINNSTGFNALPGGTRYATGEFLYIGLTGVWWSSTGNDVGYAWSRHLYSNSDSLTSYHGYTKNLGYSVRCVKDNISFYQIPSVITEIITNITSSTATSGGNITSDGGTTVTARGVCWNTTGNPTIADSKTSDGAGSGTFTSTMSGLTAGTTYYVRAYATNNAGTSYGVVVSFTTSTTNPGNTVTDIDGNVYHTITIGTQTWMVENLKTTKYRNGDVIGTTTGAIPYDATSKYQWAYDGNEANVAKYGRLYTWWAATDTRNIAPEGWHIPTDAEWTSLENYLITNGYNYDGSTTSNKIAKALAATTDWATYTETGAIGNDLTKNNSSGFAALPGGYRSYDGPFFAVGDAGFWWGYTQNTYSNAWARSMGCYSSGLGRHSYTISYGFSVRCVRD